MIGWRHSKPSEPSSDGEECDEPSGKAPVPDQAWKALGLVNDWVKHAETKSAATLAAAGVIGGVLYNLVKNRSHPGVGLSAVAALCGLATLAAAAAALMALAPRLTIPTKGRWRRRKQRTEADDAVPGADQLAEEARAAGESDPINLLFFGDIARKYQSDPLAYTEVLATLSADNRGLTEHIALQVHANSLVANRKFTLANRAIWALGVALLFLAFTTIIVSKI